MKIALSGSTGKMGQSIKSVSGEFGFEIVAGLSTEPVEKFESNNVDSWDPNNIDVVVDFSLPEGFETVLQWAKEHSKPLVSGTTGFKVNSEETFEIPFFYSRNFSLGIASLSESLRLFKSLGPSKVWIEDIHHDQKLDSPSGTALQLREIILGQMNCEVDISSIRGGSVFGVHKIHFLTQSEWVTLSHEALNREVFARGALRAANWLTDQSPGFYGMKDFINS